VERFFQDLAKAVEVEAFETDGIVHSVSCDADLSVPLSFQTLGVLYDRELQVMNKEFS
jgi:hypothetical protein